MQAAVKYYADQCRARGKQMPTDLDLLNRCHVEFLDENDREVALDVATITWDE